MKWSSQRQNYQHVNLAPVFIGGLCGRQSASLLDRVGEPTDHLARGNGEGGLCRVGAVVSQSPQCLLRVGQ